MREGTRLRILVVDDDEDDYVITRELLSEIEGQEFDLDWAATYDVGLEEMCRNRHDIYLLDYRLGEQDGLELLREAIANGCRPPKILLTGQDDRAVDVEAMKAGATDFLVKSNIDSATLERSIRYAIERSRVEAQRESLIRELEEALSRIKTLSGLLPICSGCKRIRDDGGYWNELEIYIRDRSDADFSHGICPACVHRLYPGIVECSSR